MRTLVGTLVLMVTGTALALGQTKGDRSMGTLYETRHLSVHINRTVHDVYAFASVPENFPRWASGLGTSVKRVDREWIAETPEGPMKVRFTEQNRFGILDHYVIPKSGAELYIPLRVIANGVGSEVMVTLFRRADVSEEKFAADAEWVMRDLTTLKTLLEAQ